MVWEAWLRISLTGLYYERNEGCGNVHNLYARRIWIGRRGAKYLDFVIVKKIEGMIDWYEKLIEMHIKRYDEIDLPQAGVPLSTLQIVNSMDATIHIHLYREFNEFLKKIQNEISMDS